jgi:predicted alpha/beta-fold hydrolase
LPLRAHAWTIVPTLIHRVMRRQAPQAEPGYHLEACCAAIDRPEMWVYRRYLLAGLNRIYARVAQRRPVPATPAQARRIRTIRAWDDAVVAPRHGFASAHDYYSKTSVGPRLGLLAVPCLLVAAERDPMVPLHTLRPWLDQAPPSLDFHLAREGGHVGFPAGLDLDQDAPRGLEGQVVGWLRGAPSRQLRGISDAVGGAAGMRALTPNS